MYIVSKSYTDTSIKDSLSAQIYILHPSKKHDYTFSDKMSKFFSKLPADTLSIFFVSPDTVSKYGWKQVQSRYLILKRKDISLQDLVDNQNVITYPWCKSVLTAFFIDPPAIHKYKITKIWKRYWFYCCWQFSRVTLHRIQDWKYTITHKCLYSLWSRLIILIL